MSTSLFEALVPYGWSERVRALWGDVGDPDLLPARVVRVERGAAVIVRADGSECTLRSEGPVAVGDWVAAGHDALHHVLPRWSAVTRADPAQSGAQSGTQVLASNVDVVVITAPADRCSASRVERELAVAWDSGARPLVVLTKTDLDTAALGRLRTRLTGVTCIGTSAQSGEGLGDLLGEIGPGRTGVLLGPSGAGKSTLVNALLGEAVQATGSVRAGDRRGRHTTSSRQLLCLPGGGVLIDTPGVRSIALVGDVDLDDVFPEIDAMARECRFRDCRHETEPGCAVTDALARGRLEPGRLASFRKLSRESHADRRQHDPVARREAQRLWKLRALEARHHDKRRTG